MRIVVMSDSHGRADRVKKVIEEQPEAELFIFLGDGTRDFHAAMRGVPKEDWCVCGNCDFGSSDDYNLVSYVRDIKFYCTHGHQWNVKYDPTELIEQAKQKEVRVLLYGHTHQAFYEYQDGLHIMNPGSLGSPRGSLYPTYGVIDIQGKQIVCSHRNLKD
jgi:putative phosphoesterase